MEKEVVYALSDPENGALIRMRDEYTVTPTAMARPFARGDLTWARQPTETGFAQLDKQYQMMFLFRDAMRNHILYDPNPNSLRWKYQWMQALPGDNAFLTASVINDIQPVAGKVTDDSQWKPHGDILWSGIYDGKHYIWIDTPVGEVEKSRVEVGFNADPGTGGVIELYRYNGGKDELVGSTPTVAGQTAYALDIPYSSSDYYRVRVAYGPGVSGSIFIVSTGLSSCWCHREVPSYSDNSSSIEAIRIQSSSLLIRNTSSSQFAQGSLGWVQIGKQVDWTLVSTSADPYEFIGQYSSFKEFYLRDGGYGYIRPEDSEDFDMRYYFQQNRDLEKTGGFPLVPFSSYVCVVMKCDSDEAKAITYRTYSIVEFVTNNEWLDRAIPSISPKAWTAGVEMLVQIPQFHENPLHLAGILNAIRKGASIIQAVAGTIPHPYAQIASQVAGVGGSVLDKVIPFFEEPKKRGRKRKA